ncbi:hypothetical protein LINGRAHAP2_LOCUS15079, partial [Linum grandiflorum]
LQNPKIFIRLSILVQIKPRLLPFVRLNPWIITQNFSPNSKPRFSSFQSKTPKLVGLRFCVCLALSFVSSHVFLEVKRCSRS